MTTRILFGLLVLATAGAAPAQGPEIAFGPWTGLTVNNVGGPPCSQQDCALYTYNLSTAVSTLVTVNIYGDSGFPFILAAANTATQCTVVPGIQNRLMLDMPIVILLQGTMPAWSGPTICGGGSPYPPGRFQYQVALPPGFLCTPGLQVCIQALVFESGNPTFTCTVRITC